MPAELRGKEGEARCRGQGSLSVTEPTVFNEGRNSNLNIETTTGVGCKKGRRGEERKNVGRTTRMARQGIGKKLLASFGMRNTETFWRSAVKPGSGKGGRKRLREHP